MGLDITASSRCRFVAPQIGDDWDEHYELGHVHANNDLGFMDRLDGLSPGWYVSDGESLDFRAGSYSGYGRWRAQLCRLALGVEPEEGPWKEPERFAGQPFVELINFTDCDGTIGPLTAAKLAADFEANAALPAAGDIYFAEKYAEWTKAFRLASDGGLVRFH